MRKSPVRHTVKKHKREGNWIESFERGTGARRLKRKSRIVGGPVPPIVSVGYEFSFPDPDRPPPMSVGLTEAEKNILNTHSHVPRGKIYHVTDRIDEVLQSNELRPSTVADRGYLSLTANPRFQTVSPERVAKDYRIELDFDRLKKDYPELVPVSYSWTGDIPDEAVEYYRGKGFDRPTKYPQGIFLINSSKHFRHESEWLIIKPIKNLSKYITRIESRKQKLRS